MASGVSKATERFMQMFKPGRRERHLPNFSVVLKRTPTLAATQASFIVPLWFSKFDLKDYLWHAYGVGTRGIRVYVKQGPVVEGTGRTAPTPKRWHRKRSTKHMTVDLCEPFVWPEMDPDADKAVWKVNERKDAQDDGKDRFGPLGPLGDAYVSQDRRDAMKEQAQLLREGKRQWRPGMGKGW